MINGRYGEILLFVILLFLPFALSKTPNEPNEEDYINISDYAYPNPNDPDPSVYRIALFGTNDLHGYIFPVKIYNQLTKDFYESGGVEYMASYISQMRKDWGDRFIWLDAGDQYQGGLEFAVSKGKIMNAFYNTKKLTAIGIGNHDFDLTFEGLKENAKDSNFDYLVSNIYDTQSKSFEFMPKQKRSQLYTVGKVKIGVVGVATLQTPTTTTGFPSTLQMKDHKDIIRAEAKALREKGANAVILLSHIGTKCNDEFTKMHKLQMRTKETEQDSCKNESDEFHKLISSFEPGIIDGVVAGHLHGMNHHWINNIPTIQSYGYDYSNIMYLAFDTTTWKLIPEKVSLEGPLPSCGRIFEKTRLCRYLSKEEIATAGLMKKFTFHGALIEKDPELKAPFDEWRKIIDENQNKYITTTEDELKIQEIKESTLTNIFNEVGLKVTGAHLSFMNLGGFRTTWFPGPLNEIDMFKMSPFPSFYVTFEMTGNEVLQMLKTIQGGKIIYPFGGLKLYCKFDTKGYIKIIDVKLYNGYQDIPLDPKKQYTVCTSDYLANGGSRMASVLKWYKMRKRVDYPIPIRDQVTDFLKRMPNVYAGMFVDKNNPRVRFLNPPSKNREEGSNDSYYLNQFNLDYDYE